MSEMATFSRILFHCRDLSPRQRREIARDLGVHLGETQFSSSEDGENDPKVFAECIEFSGVTVEELLERIKAVLLNENDQAVEEGRSIERRGR